MFVLSKISDQDALNQSVVIYPLNNTACVVALTAPGQKLILYKVKYNDLVYLESINLDGKVLAIAKIRIGNQEAVVYLDDQFQIGILFIDNEFCTTIKILAKLSTTGQSMIIDMPICMVADPSENTRFIAFHIFRDVVHVFHFNNILSVDAILGKDHKTSRTRRKKRRSDLGKWWSLESISVARISVKQIAILEKPTNTMAILYKDVNSNFFVRCLSVKGVDSLHAKQPIIEFEQDLPCLIIPLQAGGYIVLSTFSVFYFPHDQIQYITISSEINDISIIQSHSKLHCVKELIKSGNGICEENYVSFEVIDKTRFLVIAESGRSYLLFTDMEISSKTTMIINQMTMISLGEVTIPYYNGLSHISGDLFFQSSQFSRSVLFLVLPEKPHIHIRAYIESSPPVLDIKDRGKQDEELYTCQGSWEGSELRKYGGVQHFPELLNTKSIDMKIKKLTIMSSMVMVYNANGDSVALEAQNLMPKITYPKIDLDVLAYHEEADFQYSITRLSLSVDGKPMVNEPFIYFSVVPEINIVVAVSDTKRIYVLQKNNVFDFKSEVLEEITSIDAIHVGDGTILILATDWNGRYQIWKVVNKKVKSLFYGELQDNTFVLDSVIIQSGKNGITVFMLTKKGSLHQLIFALTEKGIDKVNSTEQYVSDVPCILRKFKDNVLVFNSKHLTALKKDELLGFFVKKRIYVPDPDIADVCFVTEDVILIGYRNGRIDQVRIILPQPIVSHQSLFSNKLYLKCLPVPLAKYLVGVVLDNSTDSVNTQLHLVDTDTFELLSTYEFDEPPGVQVVDICLIQEPQTINNHMDGLFVCLTLLTEFPLYVFGIEESKLVCLNRGTISGMDSLTDIKLNSISLFDQEKQIYLCSGNIVTLIHLNIDDQFQWTFVPRSAVHSPAFVVSQWSYENVVYLADAIHGAFSSNVDELEKHSAMKLIKVDTDSMGNQMTAITALRLQDNRYVIIGDALGNVNIIQTDPNDPLIRLVFKFNIGDQINCISALGRQKSWGAQICAIGTVLGGLFILNKTDLNGCCESLVEFAANNHLELLECDEESINKDDKSQCNEIISDTVIERVLNHFIANPIEFSQTYNNLYLNRHRLQLVHFECNSI